MVDTASGKEPAIGGFKTDDGESRQPGDRHTYNRAYIPEPQSTATGGPAGSSSTATAWSITRRSTTFSARRACSSPAAGSRERRPSPGAGPATTSRTLVVEDGLPSVIVAGLSAAMSGFSIWGHDVGGYLDGPFSHVSPADLFMRWTQFGCFSPIMQMHRQVDGDSLRQYPWGYPEAGETTDEQPGSGQLRVLRDAPYPAVPLPQFLRQAVERDRPADPPPAGPDASGRRGNVPPARTSTISAATCSSPR